MISAPERKIWLVSASVQLYDEDQTTTIAQRTRELAEALGESGVLRLPVLAGPVLTTPDAAGALVERAEASQDCAAIIVWFTTTHAVRELVSRFDSAAIPLCFLHSEHGVTLPRPRTQTEVAVIVGHHGDPAVMKGLANWSRAVSGNAEAAGLHTLVLDAGLIASGMEREPDKGAVDSVVADYREYYEIEPDLDVDGAHHDALVEQARREVVIRRMIDEMPAAAFCSPPGMVTGLAVQHLMACGYGFSTTTGVPTAGLVRCLKLMGEGAGGTTFTEFTDGDGTSGAGVSRFGPHMLDICPTIAEAGVRPRIVAASSGGRRAVPRIVTLVRPGPAVLCTTVAGGLVALPVRVSADTTDPGVGILHIRPDAAPGVTAECRRMAGAGSNWALTTNVEIHVVESFAAMAGRDFLPVNGETTVRTFRRMLKGGTHGDS